MQPRADAPEPPRAGPRPISRRASVLGIVIALLLLAGLGWLAWSLTRGSAAGAPGPGGFRGTPPTTVGVATVARADIPVVLEALGTVTPAATVTVQPQVSGVLQQLHFREGQMVRRGDLLASIDPRQFEMALQQATGQRQRDEAQLENAKLTLQRFRTLLAQDSIARQEVDTQAALVKQLEAAVVADRANEGTARLNLGYTRITAPISGRVGLRVVDVGNVVNAGEAAGLVVITQIEPIDVLFSVPQDRVPEVLERTRAGGAMPVVALDRSRTKTLASGSFATLDNLVDTQTGTVRAKARFANADGALFPNQFVNVRLQLRTLEGALVVPVTALRHGNAGDYVYVLNEADRTVSLRPVTRGIATTDRVAIESGLKAGERVITEGADRLRDGATVMLPGDKPAAGPTQARRAAGMRRAASAPNGAGSAANHRSP
jgi:multidrug efflux system membrane fusion protein